jgi:hypothetical protein
MLKKIDKNTYYYKYRRQAYIFEGIGISGIAAAVLINELTGNRYKSVILIFAAVAMLFLVIGGASSRPHVLVKSFATLLANEPTTQNAREFLYALEHSGTVHLVKSSRNIVNMAILSYERASEHDEETAEKLREAVKKHVKNKII